MHECCACGATSNVERFESDAARFADGSRLGRDAFLCATCVGTTTLRRVPSENSADNASQASREWAFASR